MKFRITMKDPDGVWESVSDAVADSVEELNLRDDEAEMLIRVRRESVSRAIARWIEHHEYLTVEIDTDNETCIVVPRGNE